MLLNKKQAAELLQISVRALDELRAKKGLPAYRIGGVCRFSREEILQWMEQCREGNGFPNHTSGEAARTSPAECK